MINPLLTPVQTCRLQEVAVLSRNHQEAAGDQPIPARGQGANFELPRILRERDLGQAV